VFRTVPVAATDVDGRGRITNQQAIAELRLVVAELADRARRARRSLRETLSCVERRHRANNSHTGSSRIV
jgi:hypothetical protein